MTVPSKLLNTDKHRIENNFHSLKYVIKFQITMSEIIRQMAVPLQLLFHFFNHLTEEIKMKNFVCLDMRSQNVQTLSLFLTSRLPVSSLLKIKTKFGYIILRRAQTSVFGPPGSRSVCQRYRSGPGFGSGNRIWVLLSSRKKNKKNFDFYCFFYDILALKNDVNVVMYLQKKQKS